MKNKSRKKEEAYVSCLSCGKTSLAFVLVNEDGHGLKGDAVCPKCSNVAYTSNLQGLWYFMQAASKQIAQLKLDLIDLQGDESNDG